MLAGPKYFQKQVDERAELTTRQTIDAVVENKVNDLLDKRVEGSEQERKARSTALTRILKLAESLDVRIQTIEHVFGLIKGRQKAVFVILAKDEADTAFESAEALRLGIRAAAGGQEFWVEVRQANGSYRSVKVALIDVNDFRDFKETEVELERWATLYECVLVLGHSDSTRAKTACNKYYEPKGIPLILLGPTNPKIMKEAYTRGVRHYMRLLPNDNFQIAEIKEIITAVPRYKNVVIYWDKDNETYSAYITEELKRQLDRFPTENERIVTPLALQAQTVPDRRFLKDYADHRPDVIVYVGLPKTARAMIEAWRREVANAPAGFSDPRRSIDLVFTDGCTGAPFLRFMTEESGWGRMVLLTAMPKPDIEDPEQLIDYGPVGVVAGHIAFDLLDRAGRTGLISRLRVAEVMGKILDADDYYWVRTARPGSDAVNVPLTLRKLDFRPSEKMGTVKGENRAWEYNFYGMTPGITRLKFLGNEAGKASDYLAASHAETMPDGP